MEDLIQVGTIGLINAINRFDPGRGTEFSSYATPTIVGEIRRHFRDKVWDLKVPRKLQDLNQRVRKIIPMLEQDLFRPPTHKEIADKLKIDTDDVLKTIAAGNAYHYASFDDSVGKENESAVGTIKLEILMGADDPELERFENFYEVNQRIAKLNPRERPIIYFSFFKQYPQRKIAKILNISQMHVSRLKQEAIKRLKDMTSTN